MTPVDDFAYLFDILGSEPVSCFVIVFLPIIKLISIIYFQTIEDFILLIGTIVAFIAFILWCCFPIHHAKENGHHSQFSCCKSIQHSFSAENSYSKQGNSAGGYGLKSTDHSYHCCAT